MAAVVEVARAVADDASASSTSAHPTVKKIAAVGAGGKHPQNQERDLHRLSIREYGFVVPLHTAQMKIDSEVKAGGHEDFDVPFIFPHELLAAICDHDRAKFQVSFWALFHPLPFGNKLNSTRGVLDTLRCKVPQTMSSVG